MFFSQSIGKKRCKKSESIHRKLSTIQNEVKLETKGGNLGQEKNESKKVAPSPSMNGRFLCGQKAF